MSNTLLAGLRRISAIRFEGTRARSITWLLLPGAKGIVLPKRKKYIEAWMYHGMGFALSHFETVRILSLSITKHGLTILGTRT